MRFSGVSSMAKCTFTIGHIMAKNLAKFLAPLAMMGCCAMAGCSSDQAAVSLEGECEYTEGFDPTTLSSTNTLLWKHFRVPAPFTSIETFTHPKCTVTLRWIIPDAICERAIQGGAIALRTGRAGDVARFFINDCPVYSIGTETPFIIGVDREVLCNIPSSCFHKDSVNRLFAVYDFAADKEYHGVRVAGSIGDAGTIFRKYYSEMAVSFFFLGCLLVIAFYYIVLGLLRIRDTYNLYFGLAALSFFFFMSANSLIKEVFYFHGLLEMKVDLCSGICTDIFMLLFVTRLITAKPQALAVGSAAILGICAFVSVFVNDPVMHHIRIIWYLSTIFLVPYICVFTIVHAVRKSFEARVVGFGLLVFLASGIHDLFAFLGYVPFVFTLPYSFILFIMVMTVLLAQKFVSVHNKMEGLNAVLEQRVDERTEELELSNRQKDRMISVIAHDLNNPITAINITSSLMEISVKNREYKSLAEYASIIKQACTQAMNTMTDVLRQARRRETETIVATETVDLVTFLGPICRQYRLRAREKGVAMVYNEVQAPVFATINSSGFTRVVDNLLSNALKFTPAKGRITLSVQAKPSHALVIVTDTGIGIPEEIKGSVFQRFTSAGRTGTDSEKSTGLGLSIARDIVEKHNGRIWFESIKGQGTTFFVEMPRIAVAPA
jgi:signal transduction histidine kinase